MTMSPLLHSPLPSFLPSFLSPPLRSLDADHPHVLRVVYQLAVEALVLENCSNVVPVVFCYTTSDGQVVCITWGKGGKGKAQTVIKEKMIDTMTDGKSNKDND